MGFDFEKFFIEWWFTYPNRKPQCYKDYGKGSKDAAKKALKRKVATQEKANEIMLALREQLKFQKAEIESGETKHLVFPMASTYVNQDRWSMEIGSYSEIKESAERRKLKDCSVEGCSEPVHGFRFKKCARHLTTTPKFKAEVKQTLISNNLMKLKSETTEEWRLRLREFINLKSSINLKGVL